MTMPDANAASYSERHPHEPEVAPVLDAEGRCLVCALSVREDEIASLRTELAGDVIHAYSDGTIILDDGVTTWNPLRALEWIERQREDNAARMLGQTEEGSDRANV